MQDFSLAVALSHIVDHVHIQCRACCWFFFRGMTSGSGSRPVSRHPERHLAGDPVMGFKEIRIGDPSELLDIPAPRRVSKVEEDKEREHLRVHLRYARGSPFHCPECGVVDQPQTS